MCIFLLAVMSNFMSTYVNISSLVVGIAGVALCWLLLQNRKKAQINFKKAAAGMDRQQKKKEKQRKCCDSVKEIDRVKIFYATQAGRAKHLAESLQTAAGSRGLKTSLVDLRDYDPEDNLMEEVGQKSLCVFLISTYTDGDPPQSASWFYKWLGESALDFRVSKTILQGLHFAVVALGSSAYQPDAFCKAGRNVDHWLDDLGAKRIMKVGILDDCSSASTSGGLEADFVTWEENFWKVVHPATNMAKDDKPCCHGKGDSSCHGDGHDRTTYEVQYEDSSEDELSTDGGSDVDDKDEQNGLVDVEDLGNIMNKQKTANVGRKQKSGGKGTTAEATEMITPVLRKNLEKQGYKLIGSHSGVKLCRWTKSMLRGRGGCYKHTFYGIESHLCMETTPSLACANKCVFCWRHHTNPVGTEWRWKMDDAETIFQGALKNHTDMIRQFRGVPGVQPEKFSEALEPRHCALSLVGEPIMYPEINRFVDLLHSRSISTFLVTNAQFPGAIRELQPVTQLYVSVDASCPESLKKIDRPLFRDYWQRFLDSLTALSDKGQRTVYRLTLVKAWNINELQGYADLVQLGKPDFIEIKGVTYCGDSKSSTLTMKNIPWHEEVVSFVQQLADLLLDYDIASEHEHSNCILIAHTKFRVDNEWWTWIDYKRFHELMTAWTQSQGQQTFTASDYMAKTPSWAVYGAQEQGFDPVETRFYRKKRKDVSGC
ncbi:hypothetical protein NP493_925g02007 [Ridgeia piscesae]|uniref:S-adenosyl-L-methionine-dependent tRNA 4-demethylwyosine synthase TYW1 n=1 Tax=Ridgeia piscesae TaxID=27915 RepID=A0AAD9KLX6_RIDPI|nr:hypothetical protein NP493_925g02007 [Ridgeia piscesae]